MLHQDSYKQHISAQFNAELESVKNHLLEMGGLVEQQIGKAVESLLNRDSGLAEEVIAGDEQVNELEINIDEECSRILARRQPAASDLRLVLAISKVTTDLERIGDEASKIARQAVKATEEGSANTSSFVEIRHIGNHVSDMLRRALDAFARLDVDMAVQTVIADREVDSEYASAMRSLVTFMMEDPRTIGPVLGQMWSLRSLERVGDHASNIAEHVIYLVRGLDVRHVEPDDLVAQVEERQ
ncbi:phosphate signaling complex protein PhoU [Haliea sp.]|jgi:phosphate transport system protein|uniref:phosphate signaling complex protein PhoU n=1 Tax=Haliea sp. TaxID=1932666 RepID=UPI000C485EA1|nr:phosphate signaling complex protein PhoU [Haliea sp.]HBM83272.1 phosphate transport system regulatory protein PhoU [Halieaceae bacterium]MAD63550.1 phosphate transport system regulatory protein PhoU [Haliea sp.]MAY93382.1 phosphate transport system regulatory protein PhoU [Haliea sp.]MBK41141.1 phosphate transport system regulatory protein PhoU [Haliea sp.]MBP71425.1 phosphate transport system regulatory protein PhoU [Haliea sp.]|tara:strand:- start:1524 stop:2249 length:726 start_codon:yes stop_codon:yes gene_type:complete